MDRLSVTLLFLFVTGAGALFPYGARFHDDHSVNTEKVYIRHVDSVHDRSKRDVRTLPTSLVLALERDGGSQSLNLTLGRDPSHIRIFKHVHGTEEPVHVPKNPDIGIYSDKKGTGLMVERTGPDQFIVAGMYNDGEYIHDIYPAHRHRRNEVNGVVSGSHIIRRAKVDLGGKIDIDLERKVQERRRALTRIEREVSNRVERDALAEIRTIEIIFYSDAADWQNFVTIANGNTADAFADALTFFGLLEECMNLNYNSLPADQLCIDIECKKLTIFMMAGEPDWVYDNQLGATINANGVLDAMSGTQATNLGPASALDPNFDHWTLFTGENLVASDGQGGFVGIAGLAFLGTLCTDSSASVNENPQGVATFTTASHELGHSQSLRHDSLVGCDDNDGFIMATSFSFPSEDMPSNYFSFSNCSIRDLIAFYAGRGQCTLMVDVAADEFNPDLMGRLAGQIYNVDAQCNRRRNGDDLCRGLMASQDPATYCQTIFCGSSENLACDAVTPMQGTTCGDQRWCINGSCVFDARAPRRPDNCPFGDEPGFSCNAASCVTNFALCCEFCSPPITEPTTEAVTEVTTEAVTAATTEAVTAATTEAVTTATTDGVTAATTEDVIAATTEAVTAATTEDVTLATTEDVTAETTEDVTLATTEDVTAATTEAVIAATTEGVTLATTEDVTAATTEDVTLATTEDVTAATTEDVTAATTEAVTAVTTEDITAATMEAVTAATTEDVTASITEGVNTATAEDLTTATTEEVTLATTEAVSSATTEAVTAATTEDVTAAITDAVTAATTKDVTAATTEGVNAATTEDVTLVTTEAVTSATTEDVTAATTEAVTDATTRAVTAATTKDVTLATTEAVTSATTEDVTVATTEALTAATTGAVSVATTEDATATDATTAAPSPGQQPGAVLSTTLFIIQSC